MKNGICNYSQSVKMIRRSYNQGTVVTSPANFFYCRWLDKNGQSVACKKRRATGPSQGHGQGIGRSDASKQFAPEAMDRHLLPVQLPMRDLQASVKFWVVDGDLSSSELTIVHDSTPRRTFEN